MHFYGTNYKNPDAIQWYRGLSIDHKINVKVLCKEMFGIPFEDMRIMFSLLEIITIFYDKMLSLGLLEPIEPSRQTNQS
jgi:hypothetical protein